MEGKDYLDFFLNMGIEETRAILGTSLSEPENVHIVYSRNTKDLEIHSLNLRSALIISQVAERALRLDPPVVLIGGFYKRLIDGIRQQVATIKQLQVESSSQAAGLTQALSYATDETVEKCQQKQLSGVLSGYDTVMLRSLQEASAKNAAFTRLGRVREALVEIESLVSFFDKEQAQQFDFKTL